MKKIIPLLVLSLIMIIPTRIRALSVSKNNLTIEKNNNETIDLYAEANLEITEIQFTLVYTTYDVPAFFNVETGLTDTNPNGITHKIIFSNPAVTIYFGLEFASFEKRDQFLEQNNMRIF